MRSRRIEEFIKGWFVGDFDPSIIKTKDYEVSVKYYNAGDKEARHVHKVATEITMIIIGRVKMNGVEFTGGDLIVIDPGESTDFEVLERTITVCVKQPSVKGDKYGASE